MEEMNESQEERFKDAKFQIIIKGRYMPDLMKILNELIYYLNNRHIAVTGGSVNYKQSNDENLAYVGIDIHPENYASDNEIMQYIQEFKKEHVEILSVKNKYD